MTSTSFYPEKRWHLLSTTIPETQNGAYPYYQRVVLTFSEPLRRDMIRGKRAIAKLNPSCVEPWQSYYIHLWMSEYFLPYVLLCQKAYDKFIIPYCAKLGHQHPKEMHESHQSIYDNCDQLLIFSTKIYAWKARVNEVDRSSDIQNTVIELQTLFPQFCDQLEGFYKLAEQYTSQSYKEMGEAEYLKLEQKASTFFLNTDRKTSTLATAAIYNGWGFNFRRTIRADGCIEESPWCSEETRIEAMSQFSYLFTEYLVCTWNDQYEMYKAMINCVYEGSNTLRYYDAVHGHGGNGCCLIS